MAFGDFFKRVLLSTRQRLTSSDLNRLQFQVYESLRLLQTAALGLPYSSVRTVTAANAVSAVGPKGFVGSGFYVSVDAASTPLGIKISKGVGLANALPAGATDIDSDVGANWDDSIGGSAPLVLSNDQTFNVQAAPIVGHSRIDIIEVKASYLATNSATVGIFNTVTSIFDATSRNTSLSWDLLSRTGTASPGTSTAPISYVTGVESSSGISSATEPAATTGYIKIARINVIGGATSIAQDKIVDLRPRLLPVSMVHVAGTVIFPGTSSGIGSSTLDIVELPPGFVLKAIVDVGSVPATGTSYKVQFYLFGGGFVVAGTRSNGAATATSTDLTTVRIPSVSMQGRGQVDATLQGILDGTSASGYDLLCATETFAIGQPYVRFDMQVKHPAGSAISTLESLNFNFTMSLA